MSLRPLLLLAFALAAEPDHKPELVSPIQMAARAIPAGPPRVLEVGPGEPLNERIAALPPGSTLRLRPGTYAGPVFVDRPLNIEGEGAEIVGPGSGTVLVIGADEVRVVGLQLRGGGRDTNAGDAGVVVTGRRFSLEQLRVRDVFIGLDLRQASEGLIRGCTIEGDPTLPMGRRGDGIRLWESDHNRVEHNALLGVRDMVVWYSEGNTFRANHVVGARYGTHFMHSDDSTVEDNVYEGNVVGIFVMYSDGLRLRSNRVVGSRGEAGVGFGFKESSGVEVSDNALLGNTTGIYLDGTPHRIDGVALYQRNLVAHNDTGVRLHGAVRGAAFLDNTLYENGVVVSADGGADATKCRFEANRWSEYAGYDLDGDGFGDLPFELRSAAGSLRDRRPELSFFQGTLAAALVDLLAAAFPMFAPAPVLTDPRPRMDDL